MTGIEIAGLLLGAIPIILEGLDIYKAGLSRIGAGFRKRKYVEKLSHALLLQGQTLEEIVKSVLLSSGCEAPLAFKDDTQPYLADTEVQYQVTEYLGEKNSRAFKHATQECDMIIQQLAMKIAAVVPSVKDSTDLLKIIKGNRESQLDLLARISLVFTIKDIKEDVEKLDASVASLDRFLRLISSNRQLSGHQHSGKAKKLAKSFWKIRKHADDLYLALWHGWLPGCHEKHEAKLFLDDRIDQALDLAKNKRRNSDISKFDFRLILVGGVAQGKCLWHETLVQIVEDDHLSVTGGAVVTPPPQPSQVQIIAPIQQYRNRSTLIPINDICSAVEKAECEKKPLILLLTENHHMAAALYPDNTFAPSQMKKAVTLQGLLLDNTRLNIRSPILPWKFKMVLALKLASSFLQLLQTPWIDPRLCINTVHFLLQTTDEKVDLSRAFLSLSFESFPGIQAPPKPHAKLKEALLELGITLLEIWHETTLEERCFLPAQPMSHHDRQAWALEWLDDANNPLPDLYHKAVSHCVTGVMDGGSRLPEWDDMMLWKGFCEGVIEPLSKISKI